MYNRAAYNRVAYNALPHAVNSLTITLAGVGNLSATLSPLTRQLIIALTGVGGLVAALYTPVSQGVARGLWNKESNVYGQTWNPDSSPHADVWVEESPPISGNFL